MSQVAIIVRNAQCSAFNTQLGSAGYVELRTGTIPTHPEDTATGTLICTITLNNPPFNTPSGGQMTLDTPSAGTAVADGTITWGRFYDTSDNECLDVTISTSGGGGELIATAVAILTNDTISITYTHVIPES